MKLNQIKISYYLLLSLFYLMKIWLQQIIRYLILVLIWFPHVEHFFINIAEFSVKSYILSIQFYSCNQRNFCEISLNFCFEIRANSMPQTTKDPVNGTVKVDHGTKYGTKHGMKYGTKYGMKDGVKYGTKTGTKYGMKYGTKQGSS